MFNSSHSEANGVLHIRLAGRLDALTAPGFEESLRKAGGEGRYLLDLSELEYVASAGLRVFLAFAKIVQRGKGRLAFCGLRDEVRQVFEMTGFTDILSIHPTAEDAHRAWTE